MEIINLILQAISTVGFPIVVTGFLLWERKTTTEKLTETIANNTKVIELLIDEMNDKRREE